MFLGNNTSPSDRDLGVIIKNSNPDMELNKFLEAAEEDAEFLHLYLRNNKMDKIYGTYPKALMDKMIKNKELYRLSQDFDVMHINFSKFIDFQKEDDCYFLKIHCSVLFFDDVSNNDSISVNDFDKSWNDIWVLTYKKEPLKPYKEFCKCNSCNANMDLDENNIFKCSYCGSVKLPSQFLKSWQLVDIEVKQ